MFFFEHYILKGTLPLCGRKFLTTVLPFAQHWGRLCLLCHLPAHTQDKRKAPSGANELCISLSILFTRASTVCCLPSVMIGIIVFATCLRTCTCSVSFVFLHNRLAVHSYCLLHRQACLSATCGDQAFFFSRPSHSGARHHHTMV